MRLTPLRAARWTAPLAACMFLIGARQIRAQGTDSSKAVQTTTRSGVYTAAQAEEGKNLFLSSCQSCHATSEINDGTLWTRWTGKTVQTIYGYLRENMPQDNPGGLADDDYAKVVSYILQLNKMPAGAKALPTDTTALKLIQVVPDSGKTPSASRVFQGHRP